MLRERPPIPNRAIEQVVIESNMLNLYAVIQKWEQAGKRAYQHPSEGNMADFQELDRILAHLFAILPDLEKPNGG